MKSSFRSLVPVAAIAGVLAAGSVFAQAPLDVEGISDRSTHTDSAWFRVPSLPGYSYRVYFDGAPVPTDIALTNRVADYHEVEVFRTNTATLEPASRLVRFIILSDRGAPEKGLIKWTPYPPVPSAAGELAGARMRVIAPRDYPTSLPIPVVIWLENQDGRARRANGFVTAPGFEANPIQVFRGVGAGLLPPATASGVLNYTATLPGLQTNRAITVESGTVWTPRSGVLGSSEAWPENSRIHLTAGLTVPSGQTLTIGAGTIVKLNPLVNITNNGQVVINGTVDRPVVFTSTNVVWPEQSAGAWGGFVMRGSPASRPILEVNGAIFAGGAGGTGWSFPSPSTSHKSQQPVILMSNAVARLTNSAIIHTAGQVGNGYNGDLTLDHTLWQRAVTGGEYVGGTVIVKDSAVIEFPNDDGVVNESIADADYDGMYFTTGTHLFFNSLFGFAKDDVLDSGSGGAGTMWLTNCWVESALHEAHAWSGGGRVASTYDSVLINSGQGIECGWTQGSTDGSPDCFADGLLSTANSVGARIGDNYDWSYLGRLKLTNSLILHNYRDVFLKTWNTSGSSWDTYRWEDRLAQTDLRSNLLTAADDRFPANRIWNPATDGWRLARWMSTPPDAPVGVGLAIRTSQFSLASIFDGVPIRLSSFTTNPVTVALAFEDGPGTTLAATNLVFTPGETLKRIHPAGFDVWAQSTVRVVLLDAQNGELTGVTNATFSGSVPPPQVSLWVATNALPSLRLPEGMLVKLSTPAGLPVQVKFTYVAGPTTLRNGAVLFAPGETVKWIDPAGVDPAAAESIVLSLSEPVGAALADITSVVYGTPPVQVSFGTGGSSQLDLATFRDGLPVALNRVTTNDVTVDFYCERSGEILTNGTVTIAAGQAVRMLDLPTVDPDQHDLLLVSLANPSNAQLAAPSRVVFTRVDLGQSSLLVAAGSNWRYLDTGGDAGTAWRQLGYDDSGWSNGLAQLGFSDGEENDEATLIRSIGTNGQGSITYYFRQKFVVTDPSGFTNLALWLLRDDGGVVYLNSGEVFRSRNMPGGTITYTTTTLSGQNGENTVDTADLSPGRLIVGTNLLAVEIHQQSRTSSDVSFNFSLTGTPTPPPPPQQLLWGRFSGENLLVWGHPDFVLQQSDKITGPWTNRVGAVSPFVVTPDQGNAFFQLRR